MSQKSQEGNLLSSDRIVDADDLGAAIADASTGLRSSPGDVRLRTALFELLCFAGDFARAEKQLDVLLQQSPAAEPGVHVHRAILRAERAREGVFSGAARPEFLGQEPPYADPQWRALKEACAGNPAGARSLLEEALEARSEVRGLINGRSFDDLQDADDFLGGFFEVITRDGYRWLAMEGVTAITIPPPRTQRDLLWAQASIDLLSGDEIDAYVPVLYARSSADPRDAIRLGQMTAWIELGAGVVRGVGQRLLLVDGEEIPFLDVRSIEIGAVVRSSSGNAPGRSSSERD